MEEEIQLAENRSARIIRGLLGGIEAVIEAHLDDDGNMCGGIIPIGENEWEVVQEEPLTLMPSIDCDRCSSHGHIVDGKWEDNFRGWRDKVEVAPIPDIRTFRMVRQSDESGISGTGIVLEGVVFSSGNVIIQWLSSHVHSISFFPNLDEFKEVHIDSHPSNNTLLVWDDGEVWSQQEQVAHAAT